MNLLYYNVMQLEKHISNENDKSFFGNAWVVSLMDGNDYPKYPFGILCALLFYIKFYLDNFGHMK